jgi:tRNA threonylcarbamoyladenosine biosynthesis protein TsaE
MFTISCPTEADTERVGKVLAGVLSDGDVVLLNGDLGTGKTSLVIAAASALGVDPQEVTSPTFSLLNMYHGNGIEIKHFDLYRINWPEELEDIGFSEYAGHEGITFIEWAELFTEYMPEESLEIKIEREGDGRRMTFIPHGSHYEELCRKVQKEC